MDRFLNKLLQGHSTQFALFRLLQKWQKEIANSGMIKFILMDLSKAYGCLPHNLMVAKFEAKSWRNLIKLV